jgi:hypothetical protein
VFRIPLALLTHYHQAHKLETYDTSTHRERYTGRSHNLSHRKCGNIIKNTTSTVGESSTLRLYKKNKKTKLILREAKAPNSVWAVVKTLDRPTTAG